MNRFVCIHGHFYQPPRENPWLEDVELQNSSYPYHDWNERITAECYSPNSASRILDPDGRIIDLIDNYANMSFNFGPTVLSWMESNNPEVHDAIVAADKKSQERFSGHGSAIAQVYNHMILPLANTRDKRTQVVWGIADFEYRFGRRPKGMWLSETAVDVETLEVLAAHHIQFTILSPYQAARVRPLADGAEWQNVSGGHVDPTKPYLCRLPSGNSITLFFYDGPIAQDLAFNGLLKNGERFAQRLLDAFSSDQERPQLVHIATDGETYGHHQPRGDMALAYCLYSIDEREGVDTTIYSEYLDTHAPTYEVEIVEDSSWSCVHGVERWRSDCGCSSEQKPGWSQGWRMPLRDSLDWLRNQLIPLYEEELRRYLRDPWQARDDYVHVILNRSVENVERFLGRHATKELSNDEKIAVLKLLELQRHAMLMFTSCGWFFDEISGIETTQVLKYAARALQLAEDVCGVALEDDFLVHLAEAPSNLPEYENGAEVYEALVKPAGVDLLRVGAHYAISSLFEAFPDEILIHCYTAANSSYHRFEAGNRRFVIGSATIRSKITWEELDISFAVLHLGDHNLNAGVRVYRGDDEFARMRNDFDAAFRTSDVLDVVRLMDEYFPAPHYTLWHLFKDQQQKVVTQILEPAVREAEETFHHIYERNAPILRFLNDIWMPAPKALNTAATLALNRDLQAELEKETPNPERLQRVVEAAQTVPADVDRTTLGFVASRRINGWFEELADRPTDVELLAQARETLETIAPLSLDPDLWEAQNIFFSIENECYDTMRADAEAGDQLAAAWVEHFTALSNYLDVRID